MFTFANINKFLAHSLFTSNKRTFNNINPNAGWWYDAKKREKTDLTKIQEEEKRMMALLASGKRLLIYIQILIWLTRQTRCRPFENSPSPFSPTAPT